MSFIHRLRPLQKLKPLSLLLAGGLACTVLVTIVRQYRSYQDLKTRSQEQQTKLQEELLASQQRRKELTKRVVLQTLVAEVMRRKAIRQHRARRFAIRSANEQIAYVDGLLTDSVAEIRVHEEKASKASAAANRYAALAKIGDATERRIEEVLVAPKPKARSALALMESRKPRLFTPPADWKETSVENTPIGFGKALELRKRTIREYNATASAEDKIPEPYLMAEIAFWSLKRRIPTDWLNAELGPLTTEWLKDLMDAPRVQKASRLTERSHTNGVETHLEKDCPAKEGVISLPRHPAGKPGKVTSKKQPDATKMKKGKQLVVGEIVIPPVKTAPFKAPTIVELQEAEEHAKSLAKVCVAAKPRIDDEPCQDLTTRAPKTKGKLEKPDSDFGARPDC